MGVDLGKDNGVPLEGITGGRRAPSDCQLIGVDTPLEFVIDCGMNPGGSWPTDPAGMLLGG